MFIDVSRCLKMIYGPNSLFVSRCFQVLDLECIDVEGFKKLWVLSIFDVLVFSVYAKKMLVFSWEIIWLK